MQDANKLSLLVGQKWQM